MRSKVGLNDLLDTSAQDACLLEPTGSISPPQALPRRANVPEKRCGRRRKASFAAPLRTAFLACFRAAGQSAEPALMGRENLRRHDLAALVFNYQ